MRILTVLIFLIFSVNSYGSKNPYNNNEVNDFINLMKIRYAYDEKKLRGLFDAIVPEKRLPKFFKKAPERTLTWNGCLKKDLNCTNYKNLFVNHSLATGGLKYWNENKEYLSQASNKFGIPPEIIVAIIGIESKYGLKTGSFKTFDTLASLSLGPNKGRRAKFYKTELTNFLLMCLENNLDPASIKGSYAGALGQPQFISSSYRNFALDFNNDKIIDLWESNADVIGSVANYLHRNGWLRNNLILSDITFPVSAELTVHGQSKKPYKPITPYYQFKKKNIKSTATMHDDELLSVIRMEENAKNLYKFGHNNFYVITRYNRSKLYALAVYFLAEKIRGEKTRR